MTAYKGIIQQTGVEVVIKKYQKIEINKLLINQEVNAMKRLNHPSINKYQDYFQTQFLYFIIYPYFSGKPILIFLKENPQQRKLSFLKSIIKKLLQVVRYLHEQGVCHRGLDDSKIIFNGKQMLLTGFTNALTMDTASFKKHKGYPNAPTTLKTQYFPPELQNKFSNEKLDIWCVGVLGYVMVTGEFPFDEDDKVGGLKYSEFKI